MTNKQKIAITNFIRAAENPKKYGIEAQNTVEQNQALQRAFCTLFDFDEKGKVTDFNAETIEALCGLKESPKIDIL